MLRRFAATARDRIRLEGGYRRDPLRALAQHVDVAERNIRIMGSNVQTLVAGKWRKLSAHSGTEVTGRSRRNRELHLRYSPLNGATSEWLQWGG